MKPEGMSHAGYLVTGKYVQALLRAKAYTQDLNKAIKQAHAQGIGYLCDSCCYCIYFDCKKGHCAGLRSAPPVEFYSGLQKHDKPYPGDNGARYERIPIQPKKYKLGMSHENCRDALNRRIHAWDIHGGAMICEVACVWCNRHETGRCSCRAVTQRRSAA